MRQGNVLSPVLFKILIGYIIGMVQQVECGLQWTKANILKGLAFVEEICLLTEDVDSIIALTDNINVDDKTLSLNINIRKTKIMEITPANGRNVVVEGQSLEKTDRFLYLGSTLCEDGDVRREV